MKNIFLVFSLLISTTCFAQVNSESIVGSWVYMAVATTHADHVHAETEKFSLELSEAGNFKIISKAYSIVGTWQLKNAVLTLEGERSDNAEHSIENMVIHEVTESAISFSMSSKAEDNVVMKLVRKS